MNKLTNHIRTSYVNSFSLLRVDIENCPDSLWEKRIGGDYFWNQIYHALLATYHLFDMKDEHIKPEIKNAGELNGSEDISQPHDKKLMLEVLDNTLKLVDKYFSTLTDADLDKSVDCFGMKMPLINKLMMGEGHIMYHVAVCDTALRDAGLKGAI